MYPHSKKTSSRKNFVSYDRKEGPYDRKSRLVSRLVSSVFDQGQQFKSTWFLPAVIYKDLVNTIKELSNHQLTLIA